VCTIESCKNFFLFDISDDHQVFAEAKNRYRRELLH